MPIMVDMSATLVSIFAPRFTVSRAAYMGNCVGYHSPWITVLLLRGLYGYLPFSFFHASPLYCNIMDVAWLFAS